MPFSFKTSELIRRLLLSWLTAITLAYLRLTPEQRALTGTNDLSLLSPLRITGTTAMILIILYLFSRFFDSCATERWALVALFSFFSLCAWSANAFSLPFILICLLVIAVFIAYAMRGWKHSEPIATSGEKATYAQRWLLTILTLAFFLFVSIWTVGRIYVFATPTYDFGIFSQMFHYMKTTGQPLTTLERDGLLSHFHVHVSPIYYLLLPFYLLIPHPATLQVLQAAILASAVIPLWLLGRHHGLSGWTRLLLCTALLLYPALAGGTSYDIHENCFLTPLLLWLLLGIDRRNTAMTVIAALLTLIVKEDAAVYVAVIALYLILRAILHPNKKELFTGLILFISALLYFFAVTDFLARCGDGVMTNRYQNIMPPNSDSLWNVVKTALFHPMRLIYECCDPEKQRFVLLTLCPLLGLPLLTRRYERLILLIPYILVNLIPDYVYQHDIFFQYTFGSAACLFYLTAVNLADLKPQWLRASALAAAVTVSAVCFSMTVLPKAIYYPTQYVRQAASYQNICETLATVPDDASVTANTFYTTFLSQREILYDLGYASKKHMLETEYVVINLSATDDFQKFASHGKQNGYGRLLQLLLQNGYEEYAALDNVLVIFRKAS